MISAPTLKRPFGALRRSTVCGVRTLLIVSMVLFAAQAIGALATRHAMNSQGAGAIVSNTLTHAPQAETAQAYEDGCCQPAGAQPACDCSAVPCAAAPATLASAATIQVFQRPLRHVFFDPAHVLSAHTLPPELGPPRA